MKANELRIGNYVNYMNNTYQILGLDGCEKINGLSRKWLGNELHGCNIKCKPIPLTEEWRLKLGFKRRGISSQIKIGDTGMELCWYDNEEKLRLQTIKSGFTIPLDIKNEVHIIQNLVFALTNKELTLK